MSKATEVQQANSFKLTSYNSWNFTYLLNY